MAEAPKAVWAELRKPFPEGTVGKLPKLTCKSCRDNSNKVCPQHTKSKCADCGNWISSAHIHLDYVGHAAVTDRLNSVVGHENWELRPLAFDEFGNPLANAKGELWCCLTILEATKLCVGDGSTSSKELIGDALRNGAMRFGVALDLWSKEELESHLDAPELKNEKAADTVTLAPTTAELIHPDHLQALRSAFTAAGLSGKTVTDYCLTVINKEKPTTNKDVDDLLKSLEPF